MELRRRISALATCALLGAVLVVAPMGCSSNGDHCATVNYLTVFNIEFVPPLEITDGGTTTIEVDHDGKHLSCTFSGDQFFVCPNGAMAMSPSVLNLNEEATHLTVTIALDEKVLRRQDFTPNYESHHDANDCNTGRSDHATMDTSALP